MKRVLTIAILLHFAFVCEAQKNVFVCSNSQQLTDFKLLHHSFSKAELPKDTVLFGQLVKEGQSSIFYFFQAKEQGIEKVRVEIDPYAFKIQDGVHWGYLSVLLKAEEFEKSKATKFQLVGNVYQIENMSRIACTKWFKKHKTSFDLNNFKQTERYKKALAHLNDIDFNKKEFKPKSIVTFIDLASGLIGLNMGSHELMKNMQRGDYLTYHVIYNFRHKEVKKVYIHNTGYFLE